MKCRGRAERRAGGFTLFFRRALRSALPGRPFQLGEIRILTWSVLPTTNFNTFQAFAVFPPNAPAAAVRRREDFAQAANLGAPGRPQAAGTDLARI